MIRIRNLKKKCSDTFTLEIPSLEIEDGARVALIGPNGAGKSTLLRLLAGITKPDEGSIDLGAPKGGVGYQPQTPYVFKGTVEQNVRLALSPAADADALMASCGLTALKAKKTNRISGGEKQRTCLCRMLAGRYRVLLLDEPLSAADIDTGALLEDVLKRHCEETGATMVFSTHLPRQALTVATDVLILGGGRVEETGSIGSLSAPQSEFGRRFLSQWRLN